MSEVRDYWDAYLEYNPLRQGDKETDAGAFLSKMIENAGDALREYYGNKDFGYINEKLDRIKSNLKYPKDWSDLLSPGEIQRLADTVKLLEGLPWPDAVAGTFKQLLRIIMFRETQYIQSYLNILDQLLVKYMPTGTCYPDSWRFLIQEDECYLIHGSLKLTQEGKRVNHAWVELPTGYVYEPQTKQFFTKEDFGVLSPIENNRYSSEQAAIMVARTKNYGPWSDEERNQWLKE